MLSCLPVSQAIKSWYRRAADENNPATINRLWVPAIKDLRKPAEGDPRKRAPWQLVMSEKVDLIGQILEVEKKLPENAGKVDIALRSEIARRMVAESTKEELETIQDAINKEHTKDVARKEHLEVASKSDPEVQTK